MKRKILLIPLVLLLVISLVATGCAAPAPAPAPVPGPQGPPGPPGAPALAPAPAPRPAAPIEFTYGSVHPQTHFYCAQLPEELFAKVTVATEGRVRVRGIYGGALVQTMNTLELTESRVADIGHIVVAYWPKKLPMASAFSSIRDFDLGNRLDSRGIGALYWKMYDEFPELRAEWQARGITPIWSMPSFVYYILSREPIKTLADLKGKKVRTIGKYMPMTMEALGAVPMALSWAEIYTSLQTGLIDAVYTCAESCYKDKFHEVAPYVLITGPDLGASLGLPGGTGAINNDSFALLSKADQETFLKIGREMMPYFCDRIEEKSRQLIKDYKKEGATITHLSDADVAEWIRLAPNFYELIAADLNEQGLPGTEYVKKYQEAAEDYISGKWKPYE